MKLSLRLFLPLLLVLLSSPAGFGQFGGKSHLTPSLVADTTAITPGKAFTVGVYLQMDPGWHTYWQFPGESGAPPKIQWVLPEGFTAGEIQWPIPNAHSDD